MLHRNLTLACGLLAALALPARAQLLVPQQAVILAGDAEPDDHLGRSVSVDGDTLVVGVRDDDDECPSDPLCDSGSVHVFVRSGSTWSLQQKIVAGDANAGDDFGESVALWADTLVVGAPGVDAGGENNSGAVYVFTRSGTSWSQQGARLIPAALGAEDNFGGAVGLEADLLVASARFHDDGVLFDVGSAYVYSRSGTTWTLEAELLASDPGSFDQLGSAVDAGVDRVVLGDARDDAPVLNSGSAYVFARSGTVWSQEAKLTASTPSGSDEFGSAVSLDGDRILVGAPFADRTSVTPGAVYVFERSGTVWSETDLLRNVDLDGGDRFGASVDHRGDRLVVGAPRDNHLGSTTGSAYVFELSGTTWVQANKLLAFDGDFLDEFGQSISSDGDTVVVGAWLDDDTGGQDQGSAVVYDVRQGLFEDFCFGDGGDQMGCKDCPCSNNAKPGSRGGCLNSVGQSARLAGFGVASVSADTLHFEATGCAPVTFGLLLATDSRLPIVGMCPPGSGIVQPALLDGLRCGGGNLKRHGTRATDAQGDIGITNNGWGPPSPPPVGLIAQGAYSAGMTRQWQITYRDDALLVCGTGLNTTNGVTVMIVP